MIGDLLLALPHQAKMLKRASSVSGSPTRRAMIVCWFSRGNKQIPKGVSPWALLHRTGRKCPNFSKFSLLFFSDLGSIWSKKNEDSRWRSQRALCREAESTIEPPSVCVSVCVCVCVCVSVCHLSHSASATAKTTRDREKSSKQKMFLDALRFILLPGHFPLDPLPCPPEGANGGGGPPENRIFSL